LCFFFFFFVQSEAPSDSLDSLTGRPTLGKACSLELSTLMTQGNAVKQTTCCWSWQYMPPQAFRAMVLWDSGRLAMLIATAYPLKPCGTAAPVSLSEGNVGPLRKGHVASGCPSGQSRLRTLRLTLTRVGRPRATPDGRFDSLPEGSRLTLTCAP